MMSERQTSDGRTRGGNALEMKKPPGSVDGTVPGVERRIERMLDSYEAAAILRIHPKTLQRMARNGEIRGVQVGQALALSEFRYRMVDRYEAGKLSFSTKTIRCCVAVEIPASLHIAP